MATLESSTPIEQAPPRTVVYFPAFESQADLTNHYHRACWYLPRVDGILDRVLIAAPPGLRPDSRPAYMCASRQDCGHIELIPDDDEYRTAVKSADLVMRWRKDRAAPRVDVREGTPVLYVATNDVEAAEFGVYGRAHWALMSPRQRARLLDEHHKRFCAVADGIRSKNPRAAVVFGTGPSIDQSFDYDFSRLLTIVCNSIVQNDALLTHIRPGFICAGDAVSHHGVSAYAAKFRNDLARALQKFDCLFFTTARLGFLFTVQYPEVAHRVILAEQTSREPVFDLVERWELPQFDSTLNIHMFPLASTFCSRIYILGCDGRNPDAKKNEDFWAHSHAAQYHDLVNTGHLCHPTFDVRRQSSTLQGYVSSIERTIAQGERERGRKYFVLAPSFTPGLAEREVPPEFVESASDGRAHLR